MADIRIQSMVTGMAATNVYFVQNTATKEMLIIDPADDAAAIKRRINAAEGKPVAILLTHGHFDHILAAEDIRQTYGIPVYVEEEDEKVLEDARYNLSGLWASAFTIKADHQVKDGSVLHLAGLEIHVLHTPGHTWGSCCFYLPVEKVLFSGDTLFCGSYGRTDFATSSARDMTESVHRLLRELPEETEVYPGHDMFTTIADEKRWNPLAYGM